MIDMKSPFPGMDPYLEQRWGDVHTRLCTYISAALQSKLPRGLRARAQEDVLLEDSDNIISTYFEPDVTIVEAGDAVEETVRGGLAVAIKPVAVRHLHPVKRRRWVEILDSSDANRVVTVIEILSPGNKASGTLNQKYREKLTQYLSAGVNVVEIDLLRTSRKRLAVTIDQIPDDRHAAYYVSICRAKDTSLWLVYPMKLRERLPVIPIPCRESDSDVPLELQPIIDQIYVEGAHDDLNYREPPEPPFSQSDAEWAASLIASRPA